MFRVQGLGSRAHSSKIRFRYSGLGFKVRV